MSPEAGWFPVSAANGPGATGVIRRVAEQEAQPVPIPRCSPLTVNSRRLVDRPASEWFAALRGDLGAEGDEMIRMLTGFLRRILGKALARRGVGDDELDELVQESVTALLGSLHTFRGDSAFATWAAAVSTRVAFTELRRRAAREQHHREFHQAKADALTGLAAVGDAASPEDRLSRAGVLAALDRAIAQNLTHRQRIATLALLRGVPTIEIAEQLDSSQNAVYKLVHDARLKLRDVLERQGVDRGLIIEISGGGAAR